MSHWSGGTPSRVNSAARRLRRTGGLLADDLAWMVWVDEGRERGFPQFRRSWLGRAGCDRVDPFAEPLLDALALGGGTFGAGFVLPPLPLAADATRAGTRAAGGAVPARNPGVLVGGGQVRRGGIESNLYS